MGQVMIPLRAGSEPPWTTYEDVRRFLYTHNDSILSAFVIRPEILAPRPVQQTIGSPPVTPSPGMDHTEMIQLPTQNMLDLMRPMPEMSPLSTG